MDMGSLEVTNWLLIWIGVVGVLVVYVLEKVLEEVKNVKDELYTFRNRWQDKSNWTITDSKSGI